MRRTVALFKHINSSENRKPQPNAEKHRSYERKAKRQKMNEEKFQWKNFLIILNDCSITSKSA